VSARRGMSLGALRALGLPRSYGFTFMLGSAGQPSGVWACGRCLGFLRPFSCLSAQRAA